jgi:biopolymer transport protein ExbB
VISAQFPERNSFIKKLSESKLLPSLTELKELWFTLQQDMTESARLGRFSREIVDEHGITTNNQLIRVGAFNLLADKEYLVVDPESEVIRHMSRPVLGNIQDTLNNWESDSQNVQPFYFDPASGELLTLLSRTPSLMERVRQGGVIGYLILSLLLIGLLVAAVRYQVLTREARRIKKQLKTAQANKNNALGRLFAVYQANKSQSLQLLELKLEEAICRELPRLERGSSILKLLATIAPMMGLLGTVTGMIGTFQSITLFGTSDPKLMAGGISMALITTVMGLIAALPLLLIHSLLHSRANELVNIIEEQSAGLIALQAEKETDLHLSKIDFSSIENEAA